ncbi:MAG: hypothetical protein COA47_14335 [Robiginitomaculum sp.]|nr:MAG: hypothetical protein COA47_14335 [Robiginitomaculum sp.]
MTYSQSQEIKSIFERATKRKQAQSLRTPADFQKSREIIDRHDKAIATATRDYRAEYATRVELATKRLIDKAGHKTKNFTRRFVGADRFDKSAIQRQAHREVRFKHNQAISRIERSETRELTKLIETVRGRDVIKDHARNDFQKAVNRRSNQDRRIQTRARD